MGHFCFFSFVKYLWQVVVSISNFQLVCMNCHVLQCFIYRRVKELNYYPETIKNPFHLILLVVQQLQHAYCTPPNLASFSWQSGSILQGLFVGVSFFFNNDLYKIVIGQAPHGGTKVHKWRTSKAITVMQSNTGEINPFRIFSRLVVCLLSTMFLVMVIT